MFDERLDKLSEECGVFGIYAPGLDVARLTYFGLFALQHRGQESAGIAVTDGCGMIIRIGPEIFNEENIYNKGLYSYRPCPLFYNRGQSGLKPSPWSAGIYKAV